MKRLVTSLLLVPILAFGMGRTPPPKPTNSTTATATYDVATGLLTSSTTYGGSRAGQAQETGSDKVSEMLAGKMEPDSEFGFFKLVRYAEDQPDAAIEQRLENNEKGAVAQLSQATSSNAPVAAIQALQSVVNNAIKEKADYKRWKESQPKPDTAGISVTGFLNGPGSHSAIALLGGKMSETISSKTRAAYSVNAETVRTDTSNTNDYQGVSNVLRHQLELKRIDLEMAKIKAASVTPAKPPVVNPPVDEVDGDTPGEAPTSSVEYDKLKKKNFIYKTRLEKRNPVTRQDAAILIPKDRPAPVSIDGIGHEIVENYLSKSEDRWLLRTKGPLTGSAATLVVTYKDGSKERFPIKALNSRTEYAPGAFKKASPGPVDPPLSTSSLFILEPDKLTLRPDFAAVVRKIDAMANVNEPSTDPVFITAGKVGPYTWGIPKPLGSYPKGALPNTWRISLLPGVKIPADVTYHRSIMQTFIQDGAAVTYPPTTR